MPDVAGGIVRRRGWIAAGCLAIGLLLLPIAPETVTRLEVGGATLNHSEAQRVGTLLATQFESPFAVGLILVVTGLPTLDDTDGLDALIEIVDAVAELGGVSRVMSYIDTVNPAFATDHGTFVLVGLRMQDRRRDEVVLELREATQSLQARLRTVHPSIELSWTGDAAFDYDVRLTSAADAARAEYRLLPVVLVLLFVIFGSLVSAVCPVAVGTLAVGLGLGAAGLLSRFWPMTILLQNIVTMIGLGIGIDYSLLLLDRMREELSAGAAAERAATTAVRTAGHTIALSGVAVAMGFAALLVIPATELRSIATGGLLVVGFAVLLATLPLPGLLGWLGHRVETGRLWPARAASQPSRRWQTWGYWVVAHPVLVLLVVGLPLSMLAWQARHISTDIPTGTWLPERLESTRGANALKQMGQSGIIQTIRVLVLFPEGTAADSEEGWEVTLRLARYFERDDRVARVQSLAGLLGVETGEQARKAIIQPALRAAYISDDARMASVEIIPREDASAGALMRYVRDLRRTDAGGRSGLDGTRILVGGLPAQNADYQDAIGGSVLQIALVIVVGSFVVLLIGFRALLTAFKAVVLNLFSVAAAMGTTVLVFQEGYGLQWLGVAEPLDGLFPAVPVIVFCVVFGLSMDYEVFLLSRVIECVKKGMSYDDALVRGLERTGRVITSAALVMIVVFAGFAMGEFLIIKILGFSAAVAVLIDATLVRLAIGPALIVLGGRWNWWPGIRQPRVS